MMKMEAPSAVPDERDYLKLSSSLLAREKEREEEPGIRQPERGMGGRHWRRSIEIWSYSTTHSTVQYSTYSNRPNRAAGISGMDWRSKDLVIVCKVRRH